MNWRAPRLTAYSCPGVVKNVTNSKNPGMSNNEELNTKRTLLDTSSTPHYSAEFPEGYGDFILKSSDGFLLSFPRLFLSHASPVFKDMLQIGQSPESEDALALSEERQTLEYLLCHIDPAKPSPQLDWNTVTILLHAADKYQIVSIFEWFENQVAFEAIQKPFPTVKEPLRCFQLATQFNLPISSQISLRQLIRCPLSDIQAESSQSKLSSAYILSLRNARSQLLINLVFDLERGLYSCPKHREGSHGWVQGTVKTLIVEPSWDAFVRCVTENPTNCNYSLPTIPAQLREKMAAIEMGLPPLSE
jgi:hypothetical protein